MIKNYLAYRFIITKYFIDTDKYKSEIKKKIPVTKQSLAELPNNPSSNHCHIQLRYTNKSQFFLLLIPLLALVNPRTSEKTVLFFHVS